jgi:cytoskeletal protein RodZ
MATNNKQYLSFGRYLKRIRLEKRIQLEAVSKETRIGIDNLLLIENQDHERLPDEVFVKGFLRAYAKVIGADGDEAVKLYLESLETYKEAARSEAERMQSGSRFWLRLLVSLGALGCVILLSIMAISYLHKADHTKRTVEPETDIIKEQTRISEKPKIPKPVEKVPLKISEKLHLSVNTLEETWMKVIIDGQTTSEYNLKPGEKVLLEAVSEFNLLIGNATGVQLRLNDQPVEIIGKSGQVVTIHLP